MAISTTLNLACLLMFMVFLAPHASAALTCNTVYSDLYPCVSYVRSGGQIPSGCCPGVKTLYKAAATKSDRQSVCSCLKSLLSAFPNADLSYAASLPSKCGVNIPYKVNPKIDCSTVK